MRVCTRGVAQPGGLRFQTRAAPRSGTAAAALSMGLREAVWAMLVPGS